MSPDLSALNTSCYTCAEYGSVNFYGAQLINDTVCPGLTENMNDNFEVIQGYVEALNQELCALAPTGTVLAPLSSDDGSVEFLRVMLYGNPTREVAAIDGSQLLNARTFEISDVIIQIILNLLSIVHLKKS